VVREARSCALFKRILWVPILTHGIFDTIAFVVIFLSLDKAG
jgi:hypothetical protein